MSTWDDVRRIALALPDMCEDNRGHDGHASWRVKDKTFVWERPLRKFTTPHFNGYPAVLVQLDAIEVGELEELIEDARLARAPKRLAAEHQRPS